MARGKKYYVVFEGRNPGVYDDWEDARLQVEGFEGARFKGYASPEEAADSYRRYSVSEDRNDIMAILFGASKAPDSDTPPPFSPERLPLFPEIDPESWAVDASCMGNPGKMEYRGVDVATGQEVFRVGPFDDATNNIGEFLAIVHAMALMTKMGDVKTIYSDSVSGMAWARNHIVKTTLQRTPRNARVFDMMARAIAWLNTHNFAGKVLKWQTERWGEIPADFGRK